MFFILSVSFMLTLIIWINQLCSITNLGINTIIIINCSELARSIVWWTIQKFQDNNYPHLHGFFAGRSCQTNLNVFSIFLSSSIDVSVQVDMIYLDFFFFLNSLCMDWIMEKLELFGIGSSLLGSKLSSLIAHKFLKSMNEFLN